MASVTRTEEQLSERCSTIRLQYKPDITNDPSTVDESPISNNKKKTSLDEKTCIQEDKCDSSTNANESDRICCRSHSTDIETDSSNHDSVEFNQDGGSVPCLTISNMNQNVHSKMKTNARDGIQNESKRTSPETQTKQFIAPKLDLKIPMRGIKINKSRSEIFHRCKTNSNSFRSFQPNAEPNNVSPTSKDLNNGMTDTLETDAPEVVSEPPMPSSSDDAESPLALAPESPMMDMVLLFAEDDEDKAHEFKEHLQKEIKIENLSIHLFSDIDCGQSELSTLDTVHDRYHNILALITPNLKLDKYACFVHEILLTVGLKDGNGKENRIIPVWTVADRMIIIPLITLKGINYHRFLQRCTSESARDSYRQMVEDVILKGRNK